MNSNEAMRCGHFSLMRQTKSTCALWKEERVSPPGLISWEAGMWGAGVGGHYPSRGGCLNWTSTYVVDNIMYPYSFSFICGIVVPGYRYERQFFIMQLFQTVDPESGADEEERKKFVLYCIFAR